MACVSWSSKVGRSLPTIIFNAEKTILHDPIVATAQMASYTRFFSHNHPPKIRVRGVMIANEPIFEIILVIDKKSLDGDNISILLSVASKDVQRAIKMAAQNKTIPLIKRGL